LVRKSSPKLISIPPEIDLLYDFNITPLNVKYILDINKQNTNSVGTYKERETKGVYQVVQYIFVYNI